MTTVSFIVPCFNEADSVDAFYDAFAQAFDTSDYQWDLVFIDDGSSDTTFKKLEALAARSERITAIQFSRNFGKEAAIWAGLQNAKGEIIGVIDADLQQSPADALAMVNILMEKPDYDIVAAYQENRRESGLLKWLKNHFYSVFGKMSNMDVVANASDFRVFRRNVAQAILALPESFRFSKGIFAWIGFNTYAYAYVPDARTAGQSKWSFWRLLKYAIEGLLAFTVSPLRIATYLGFLTSLVAVVYFVIVLVRTFIYGVDVPGYATTIGVVLILGGVQLFVIGIMGEYLARTYLQGKQRPIYIEKSRITSAASSSNADQA